MLIVPNGRVPITTGGDGTPLALNPEWNRYLTVDLPQALAVVPPTVVASLPTMPDSSLAGTRRQVTDATATTFASVVAGGGANGVPVYCDGTDWRIG